MLLGEFVRIVFIFFSKWPDKISFGAGQKSSSSMEAHKSSTQTALTWMITLKILCHLLSESNHFWRWHLSSSKSTTCPLTTCLIRWSKWRNRQVQCHGNDLSSIIRYFFRGRNDTLAFNYSGFSMSPSKAKFTNSAWLSTCSGLGQYCCIPFSIAFCAFFRFRTRWSRSSSRR